MDKFEENINKLINKELKTIFNLTNDYTVDTFKSPREEYIILYVRISNLNSPRIEKYRSESYITPPGTPRELDKYVEESPRDELSICISTSIKISREKSAKAHRTFALEENEFINLFIGIVKSYFNYIEDSIELKIHSDRLSIKFRYINGSVTTT